MKKVLLRSKISNDFFLNNLKEILEDNECIVYDFKRDYFEKDIDYAILNWYENLNNKSIFKYVKLLIRLTLIMVLKIRKVKIVIFFHNKRPHNSTNKDISIWFLKWLLMHSDKIVILSNYSKIELKKLFGNRYEKIENRIKYAPLVNTIDKYPLGGSFYRQDYNIKDTDFVYLFFGRVQEYKNIELLINAYNKCRKDNTKLLIVGNPSSINYKNTILDRINGNEDIITVLQFIEDKDVHSVLKMANVLVFPLNIESSLNSASVILAASCGIPFICPEIGTTKDFINKENFWSYTYDNDDEHLKKLIECMREAYTEYYKDKNNYILKGKALLKEVETNNSKESVREKIKDVLYDV